LMPPWSAGGIRYHAEWVSTLCLGADLHLAAKVRVRVRVRVTIEGEGEGQS
jgi:hypothetical protein